MRQIVRASLPLGEGVVLDPFMGAGSTIAAAVAVGYRSIGIEINSAFFATAKKAIAHLLASLSVNGTTRIIKTNGVVHLNSKGSKRGHIA